MVAESVFADADVDNSGELNETEFTQLMVNLKIEQKPGEFARIDTDGSGTVSSSSSKPSACCIDRAHTTDWRAT